MKIKDGATIAGLDIRMRPALIAADKIWESLGQDLVVTSGLDGTHSAGSLHYYGRALDFRTRYFSETDRHLAAARLREQAGEQYDVVEHSSHIHIEFDRKS
jgi:hypothetical protein